VTRRARARRDDLLSDFVAQLLLAQLGGAQPGLLHVNLAENKKAARTNAPVQQSHVLFRFAEVSGLAVFAAAKSTDERLTADRRDKRPVNRAVLGPCAISLQRVVDGAGFLRLKSRL